MEKAEAMKRIAEAARDVVTIRKAYLEKLIADPAGSDELQYKLGAAVRLMEHRVLNTDPKLWD